VSTDTGADSFVAAPPPAALAALLDRYAPFGPTELVPELQVFYGQSLVEIWEAAEKLAGRALPAPFWAYPWAAGLGLARLILDRPELVRGAGVVDFGCGGGVAALAAARAGAAHVVANDLDAWALAVAEEAARRQSLMIETLRADLTKSDGPIRFDVVLCSDLAYEKKVAPQQRVFLERARAQGARVLVADAGRTYFEPAGLEQLAEYTIAVPRDLEGVDIRTARVYQLA
jgi:predicted nicotinamide N-methyase